MKLKPSAHVQSLHSSLQLDEGPGVRCLRFGVKYCTAGQLLFLKTNRHQWQCAYLRVNEQRPAAGLADNDGIVDGEAVVGQALDDPLPDLHGLPKHSCHAEVCGAGDVVPLTL